MYYEGEAIIGTKVELKYCECCGGLWLRRLGEEQANCDTCTRNWEELPARWSARIKEANNNVAKPPMRVGLRLESAAVAGGLA